MDGVTTGVVAREGEVAAAAAVGVAVVVVVVVVLSRRALKSMRLARWAAMADADGVAVVIERLSLLVDDDDNDGSLMLEEERPEAFAAPRDRAARLDKGVPPPAVAEERSLALPVTRLGSPSDVRVRLVGGAVFADNELLLVVLPRPLLARAPFVLLHNVLQFE